MLFVEAGEEGVLMEGELDELSLGVGFGGDDFACFGGRAGGREGGSEDQLVLHGLGKEGGYRSERRKTMWM